MRIRALLPKSSIQMAMSFDFDWMWTIRVWKLKPQIISTTRVTQKAETISSSLLPFHLCLPGVVLLLKVSCCHFGRVLGAFAATGGAVVVVVYKRTQQVSFPEAKSSCITLTTIH